jgi:hypothetical protein
MAEKKKRKCGNVILCVLGKEKKKVQKNAHGNVQNEDIH